MWRWGKSNPRAEGFCKEVYMCETLFVLDQKILKRMKYFLIDSLCFGKKPGPLFSYPDNIMPSSHISEVYERDTSTRLR